MRFWARLTGSKARRKTSSLAGAPNNPTGESLKTVQGSKTTTIIQCWHEAVENLHQKRPEIYRTLQMAIAEQSSSKLYTEATLRDYVQAAIQKVCDRQWRIRLGAKNVQIRSVLEKVVNILERGKDLAQAAATLDPLHAGLPWAGICVLLPFITKLSSQESAAKLGLHRIAEVVEWCAILDKALIDEGDNGRFEDFRKPMIELFSAILEYEALAADFFSKGTWSRYGHALLNTDDFGEHIKTIDVHHKICQDSIASFQLVDSRHRIKKVGEICDSILLAMNAESNKRKEVLLWLSEVKYGEMHDVAREKLGHHYAHSGRWLFASDQYQSWTSCAVEKQAVLWLTGHVGTGKTSLMSIFIQSRLEILGPTQSERLAYFYCSAKDKEGSNSLAILRCILAQLAFQADGTSIATPVRELYGDADHTSGRGKPGTRQCINLLSQALSVSTITWIVVDALDECSDPEVLLEAFQLLIKASPKPGTIKVFVSSRMHVDVREWFLDCFVLGVDGNREDISLFIEKEIELNRGHFLRGAHPELERRLAGVLIKRAENVFRWVELQLQIFFSRRSRLINPDDVRTKLDELESQIGQGLPNLNDSYGEIYEMNTPQPRIREHSQRVLRWLILSLLDLRYEDRNLIESVPYMASFEATIRAVSLEQDGIRDPIVDKDYILTICSNLVVANEAAERFQFAHFSVVEYLRARLIPQQNRQEYGDAEVASQVVISSLSYLTLVAKEKSQKLTRRPSFGRMDRDSSAEVPTLRFSFSQFAVLFWPTFYHMSVKLGISDTAAQLYSKVIASPSPTPAFEAWIVTYRQHQDGQIIQFRGPTTSDPRLLSPGGVSGFIAPAEFFVQGQPNRAFAAAAFKMGNLLRTLPKEEMTQCNENGRTCLEVAQSWGGQEIVRILEQERDYGSWKISRSAESKSQSQSEGDLEPGVTDIYFHFPRHG